MVGKPAVARNGILVAGVAALFTGVLATATPALGGTQASPTWHVAKTFTLHNTFLVDVVGFSGGIAWAGGDSPAQLPELHHLISKKWHAVSLPGGSGTFVANLSATSATNVWAALANEPLVARLTSGGWVTKSFALGTDDIATDNIVTLGPKNTWVFAYDFTANSPFAEHFNGSVWTMSSLPALVDCDCSTHAVSASSAAS